MSNEGPKRQGDPWTLIICPKKVISLVGDMMGFLSASFFFLSKNLPGQLAWHRWWMVWCFGVPSSSLFHLRGGGAPHLAFPVKKGKYKSWKQQGIIFSSHFQFWAWVVLFSSSVGDIFKLPLVFTVFFLSAIPHFLRPSPSVNHWWQFHVCSQRAFFNATEHMLITLHGTSSHVSIIALWVVFFTTLAALFQSQNLPVSIGWSSLRSWLSSQWLIEVGSSISPLAFMCFVFSWVFLFRHALFFYYMYLSCSLM